MRLFFHEFPSRIYFYNLNADVWHFREQSYSIEKLEQELFSVKPSLGLHWEKPSLGIHWEKLANFSYTQFSLNLLVWIQN